MLGLLRWTGERGVTTERAQLLGLPVLQARLGAGGRWEEQRVRRAARLLARQGVRRVLVPLEFDHWQMLERRGLAGMDPLPLYRTMADQLVLAELERRGVPEQRACVALRGEYADADLTRTARLLCPKVRALIIQADRGGERLARELYLEFGAVVPPCVEADAAVRFGGERQPGELVLCGKPELCGLELSVPELELPEGLEALPLLTALWQTGRLKPQCFRVIAK